MSDREQRVREIAYFLWLDDGSPLGDPERYWLAAEGLVEPEPREGEERAGEDFDAAKKPFPSAATLGSD
jgi:hypothetical protein